MAEPEHAGQQALLAPGWNVDYEVVYIPVRAGRQMVADGIQMPPVDKRCCGLQDVPALQHELLEGAVRRAASIIRFACRQPGPQFRQQ